MIVGRKMKIFQNIRDRISGQAFKREVRITGDGFIVMPNRDPIASVQWVTILEIFAMKHDLFSYDEVCLGFRIDEAGNYIWVGEDDHGFREFRTEVERRFSIDPIWFQKVVQPPFAENLTTLWTQSPSAP